jgi:hypothetical protein
MIRKTTLINLLSISTLLAFSMFYLTTFANAAGWELPPNPGDSLTEDFDQAILNLTNWLLGLVVLVGVLAIIWGGLNYISSSGDTQKAELSKRIIYYAFLGLFVAGIAYAIVNVIVTVILK